MSNRIVICSDCDGTGKKTFDAGGHNGDLETEECGRCEGSGRVVESFVMSQAPFKASDNQSKRIY